jgi:hypothetical protein
MDRLTSLLVLGALATLALAATPASATSQLPSGCSGGVLGDVDGDGVPEAAGTCQTPPCGCNCPVVGAGVELIAVGQDVSGTLLAGCGYYLVYNADPGDVDWDGPASLTPSLYCYGGGLGNVCRISLATE